MTTPGFPNSLTQLAIGDKLKNNRLTLIKTLKCLAYVSYLLHKLNW